MLNVSVVLLSNLLFFTLRTARDAYSLHGFDLMSKVYHPLIVLMPVFEDRESATILIRQLAKACPKPPYVVCVEDGSVRAPMTADVIRDAGLQGEIVFLARNMGHQRAIATGLSHIASTFEADAVVTMDCDGEDVPEAIPQLLAEFENGQFDAVVAQRRRRSETLVFRMFYYLYRLLFITFTGRFIRYGNFAVLTTRTVRRLAAMQELWVHFAASLMISRVRIGAVPTDRGRRYAGTSQMNLVSLTLHGLRSMMVFAEDVLIRVGLSCVVLGVVSVALLGTTVLLKVIGFATPGWFSVAAGILVMILMQAGILTFVTLMVSGIVRSAPPITRAQLEAIIDRVERTVDGHAGVPRQAA